jgi:hypothetical protein
MTKVRTVATLGLALALGGAVSTACRNRAPRDVDAARERALDGAIAALRGGRPDEARDALARARALAPEHPGVLMLETWLASMYWDDEAALASLLRLRQIDPRPYLSPAEVDGRIGELLVQMGENGRALLPLQLAVGAAPRTAEPAPGSAAAGEVARRRALATLVEKLPRHRVEPEVLATELPLVSDGLPRLTCRFHIDGRDVEIPFVLDTGATFTAIHAPLAEMLGVDTVEPVVPVTDGRGRPVAARFGVLPPMSFGVGIEIAERPVLVLEEPLLPDSRDHEPLDAVVGLDLLSRFRVTLDPTRGRARFELPVGQPVEESVQCVLCDGRVMVPIEAEGTRLWFVLDSGASESSLSPAGLTALPGGERRARNTLRRVSGPGGTESVVREVPGLVLRIGGLRVVGAELPVVDRVSEALFPVHGVLGSDVLSGCSVTLDRGRLRLRAP